MIEVMELNEPCQHLAIYTNKYTLARIKGS